MNNRVMHDKAGAARPDPVEQVAPRGAGGNERGDHECRGGQQYRPTRPASHLQSAPGGHDGGRLG
jgi:hypothetical protein